MKIYGNYVKGVPTFATPVEAGQAPLFARITGAKIDKSASICYFPAFYPFLPTVYKDIKTVFPNATFTDKALDVIRNEKAQQKLLETGTLTKAATFQFKVRPYAHQNKSLLRLVYNYRNALFLACGLGKSKVLIDAIRYLREKTLILCPPSLITNWYGEFDKYCFPDELVVKSVTGKKAEKEALLSSPIDADVLLAGYRTATLYQEEIFKAFDYTFIAADESQKIKGFKSKQTKAAWFLSSKAARRTILSGTGVLNSPEDLYSQIRFLSDSILEDNYWHFCHTYQEYSKKNKHMVVGFKNMDILNKKVHAISLRYKKEDCLDLPERLEIPYKVRLSDEQQAMTDELLSDEKLYLPEGEIEKTHKLVLLGKLAQVTGGFLNIGQKDPHICDKCPNVVYCVDQSIKPYTKMCQVVKKAPPPKVHVFKENPKLEACVDIIDSVLTEPDDKVIIWAKHVWELKTIEERLKKEKVAFTSLPSDSSKVIDTVNKFNNDPKSRVLLAQISRGVGFTANSANYVIYYSVDFNLESYLQSIDRNYRIGQDRKVSVYFLIAENTIDEHVYKALTLKQDVQEILLGKVECLRCNQSMRCLVNGVSPWEKGCKLKPKMARHVIQI